MDHYCTKEYLIYIFYAHFFEKRIAYTLGNADMSLSEVLLQCVSMTYAGHAITVRKLHFLLKKALLEALLKKQVKIVYAKRAIALFTIKKKEPLGLACDSFGFAAECILQQVSTNFLLTVYNYYGLQCITQADSTTFRITLRMLYTHVLELSGFLEKWFSFQKEDTNDVAFEITSRYNSYFINTLLLSHRNIVITQRTMLDV